MKLFHWNTRYVTSNCRISRSGNKWWENFSLRQSFFKRDKMGADKECFQWVDGLGLSLNLWTTKRWTLWFPLTLCSRGRSYPFQTESKRMVCFVLALKGIISFHWCEWEGNPFLSLAGENPCLANVFEDMICYPVNEKAAVPGITILW